MSSRSFSFSFYLFSSFQDLYDSCFDRVPIFLWAEHQPDDILRCDFFPCVFSFVLRQRHSIWIPHVLHRLFCTCTVGIRLSPLCGIDIDIHQRSHALIGIEWRGSLLFHIGGLSTSLCPESVFSSTLQQLPLSSLPATSFQFVF